ncbi:MAG: ATP-dependent DNA helicase RecQ, partial [Planctomycetota bacterium]|nr:ATP-dependent DNA helicase RecQ [Planctomycetota bacterium]
MDLDHLLKDKFRLEQFRPGQRESIEAIMSGRDVLLVLPTGGGKSLCYQLPALASDGLVLVISPLIALMKDQVDGLNALGIPATFINSSISQTEQRSRIDGMRLGQFRLVYVAPERFRSPIFRKAVAEASLSLVAVDESHCVSQWGHDFRPDFLKIKDALERLGRPPTMALTATATPEVRQDIELQLGLRKPLVKVTGFDRPNLNFEVRRIGSQEAKMEMLHKHFSGNTKSGIVYCSAIKRVNEVAEYLQKNQVRALPYHSQIDLGLRHQYQERFMTGETQVMVATNAFGLGIDKHNIRSVIHLNIPATLEAYYQEAGRGGRDGADSDAILLYTYNDRFTQEFLIKNSYPPREDIEMVYQYLDRQTEEPIQKTASRMEEELGGRITDKAVYSTLVILEQAEVIERLTGRDRLAWITFLKEPSATAAKEGTIRYRLVEHMLEWGSCEPGERMGFSLDGLSEAAGLQEPQVRRTLHEMEHEGIVDYQPPFRGRGVRMLS